MPTPSELRPRGEWAAKTDTPRRSVFGNYRPTDEGSSGRQCAPFDRSQRTSAANEDQVTLQTAIDLAVARAFLHRFLAQAYEDPTPEGWTWLCAPGTQENLRAAVRVVAAARQSAANSSAPLEDSFQHLSATLGRADATAFSDAYIATFGHAARGGCPLNEIEYGDIKADPLFQPHRLADLAAFYRAFGLEVAEDAGERHDHICLELEFMTVLVAKEAYALEHQLDAEHLTQCREAQRKFLREHLGRWTPAFTRRLAAATKDPTLRALAECTRFFIESECTRLGLKPGSEELALRPVDEATDRMCDSCGINNLPPGALATP